MQLVEVINLILIIMVQVQFFQVSRLLVVEQVQDILELVEQEDQAVVDQVMVEPAEQEIHLQ